MEQYPDIKVEYTPDLQLYNEKMVACSMPERSRTATTCATRTWAPGRAGGCGTDRRPAGLAELDGTSSLNLEALNTKASSMARRTTATSSHAYDKKAAQKAG
jgi:hypothetical protein